jgi:hypothetical protein
VTDDPPLHTLRSEFSTYLCFDPATRALIHLPAGRIAGHALVCTTKEPS